MSSSGVRATVASFTTGLLLVLVLVYVWDDITTTPGETKRTLFAVVSAFTVLAMLAIYQLMQVRERAERLAHSMTKSRLTYSHEIFSILYRNSSVPFIVVDKAGTIESMNPATARLFNVELDALNGLDAFSFIEAEDPTKTSLIPEYFRQGKIVNDVEVEIHRPDGTSRWVLLAVFTFQDGKGVRKGLLTLIDVTKQRMVDKAKTEFVSLASHQLRTPISAMKWNLELFASAGKDNLTPLQAGYLEKLQGGLERMDMLVGDFLSVSKFELGTLVAQYTSFNAKKFLESVYDEHAPLAAKKKVVVDTDLGASEGLINSDSHLLHMIVSNLVSNAVKYTPEGGRVRLHGALDGAHFTVTVSDTGMGIPEEEQDMIFSKLFRASNAKTEVTDGTGLGLYIVKEAVKILGGDITFRSEAGVGTTFTVVLPK